MQMTLIPSGQDAGGSYTLSVVIPTYDTAAMTLACCRAVLASAPPATEVIVADDGSRDGTAELLAREVPNVHVVRLEENRGYSAAANLGVLAAHGRIILLLNSDAIVEGDALNSILRAFDADPHLGIASAQLLNEDGTPQWTGGRAPTLAWLIGVVSGAGSVLRRVRGTRPPQTNREVDWVSGAAMAFRREVWSDAGPLSERFRFYCQDIELCVRAKAAGWRVRILDDARVTHTIGATAAKGPLPHDPAILWPDLLAWGALHYGRAWAIVARMTLVSVAAMRVAFHKRDATRDALARGLRALLHSDS
jgi:GT2 family glycosyltransferase